MKIELIEINVTQTRKKSNLSRQTLKVGFFERTIQNQTSFLPICILSIWDWYLHLKESSSLMVCSLNKDKDNVIHHTKYVSLG